MACAHRPRERRLSVVLPARMKDHRGWHDVRILNISSKGLMARSPAAPSRGSYLELRRGHQVIVARVVWTNGQQFGVQSQSRLVPGDFIDEKLPEALQPAGSGGSPAIERRSIARPSGHAHEQSRWRGRTLEFMGLAAMAAVLCGLLLDASQHALAQSMKAVNETLAAGRPSSGS